jgi:hypothetical protein
MMACSKASRPKNPEAATVPAADPEKCGVSEHPPPERRCYSSTKKGQ